MKKLLFRRYPLIGHYLTLMVLVNFLCAGLVYMVFISAARTDPFFSVTIYAMAVVCNLFLVPLSTIVIPVTNWDKPPKREGIWEWYSKGKKYLVKVCDCAGKLRVAWSGGYYNVSGAYEPLYNSKGVIVRHHWNPSEWTDGMWGDRVDDLANMDKYKTLDTISDI